MSARTEAERDAPLGWALVGVQVVLFVALVVDVVRRRRPLDVTSGIGLLACLGGSGLVLDASGRLGSRLRAHPAPHPDTVLRTDGAYGVVRHPIYLGLLIFGAGLALLARSWRAAACVVGLVAVFDTKARIEERLLAARFPEYEVYAARVPRILPLP
jgi:protein-S-isoprenylcysteine O-methyltransferase Ste14